MSTIATSRKTTPTDNRQEEIAYDLLQQAQLHSTAVNKAAPSNAVRSIDENDYITPEHIRQIRTQPEVTRLWYLSQHSYIARSCALPISQSLPLTVNVRLWRRGCLRTNSAYRESCTMKVHLCMRSYPMAMLTYDENEDSVTWYSMSIYDFSEYQSCEIQFRRQYLQYSELWCSPPDT